MSNEYNKALSNPNIRQILSMVPNALIEVSKVCENALASGHHQPDDWKNSITDNLLHGFDHLILVESLDGSNKFSSSESHLVNACCRLLMALQLRIENAQSKELPE